MNSLSAGSAYVDSMYLKHNDTYMTVVDYIGAQGGPEVTVSADDIFSAVGNDLLRLKQLIDSALQAKAGLVFAWDELKLDGAVDYKDSATTLGAQLDRLVRRVPRSSTVPSASHHVSLYPLGAVPRRHRLLL